MSNLTRYKFKNICLDKGFIRGPFGSALKKSLFVPKSEDTYKVYEQCVPLEQDKSKGNYYITSDYFRKSLSRFEVKHNDFLVSCSGVNYGAIYHLKEPFERGVINQALLIIRVNNKIVDYNYFKYLFKIVLSRAITSGTGDSTIPNFPSIDVIKDIDVYLPTIDVQQKIGAILNCIDEKMINNIYVNDYLQHMAKTIYDYWFVQFDFPDESGKPYRTSGGAMKWNEQLKREIPNGWGVTRIGNICDFRNGINYDKGVEGDREYRIINVRNLSSSSLLINEAELDKITLTSVYADKYLLSSDDIVIARSGTPGATRLLWKINEPTIFCGFIICLTPHETLYKTYLTYCLKRLEGTSATKTGGSILQNVSQDTLKSLFVLIPDKEVLRQFNTVISPILEKIHSNINENNELTKLREWLLPMLMNGQARVE